MNVIRNQCKIRELIVTSIQSGISELKLQAMPTVCLIAASSIKDRKNLSELVKEINNIGCVFYVCWGTAADEIHDLIDEIIETGDEAWLSIATTTHKDESLEDVGQFFLNATYLDPGKFRCLAILDEIDYINSSFATKLLELHIAENN